MDGVLVSTEMVQGAHRWVVYVQVNNESTRYEFDTQEEATEFANNAFGSEP